jgi:hypothetical protein
VTAGVVSSLTPVVVTLVTYTMCDMPCKKIDASAKVLGEPELTITPI